MKRLKTVAKYGWPVLAIAPAAVLGPRWLLTGLVVIGFSLNAFGQYLVDEASDNTRDALDLARHWRTKAGR